MDIIYIFIGILAVSAWIFLMWIAWKDLAPERAKRKLEERNRTRIELEERKRF